MNSPAWSFHNRQWWAPAPRRSGRSNACGCGVEATGEAAALRPRPRDAVPLQLQPQVLAIEPGPACRLGDVVPRSLEEPAEIRPFEARHHVRPRLVERLRRAVGRDRGRRATKHEIAFAHADAWALGHDEQAPDDVLQLSHVAGTVVGSKSGERLGREAYDG